MYAVAQPIWQRGYSIRLPLHSPEEAEASACFELCGAFNGLRSLQ